MRRRRVAFVTGTRAEYGLLKSSLAAAARHPRLHPQIIATGLHLLRAYGATLDDIRRDGWPVDAVVPMQRGDDHPLDAPRGLARGVHGIAAAIADLKSDIVVVLGDRIEALAGALAGVTTGRTVAHIHGGDVAEGDFDESLRHAITKLAHLHLAASHAAARRIARMGEAGDRIHVAGAPGLDRIAELLAEASGEREPEALILQHAYGRPPRSERQAALAVLQAVADCGLRPIIIRPNADRGCSGVHSAIEAFCRTHRGADVQVHASLPRDEFLRRLLRAAVLVGNSSSGIIEAPFAGTPSVNVGRRQAGRQPGGPSVLTAPERRSAIRSAIRTALSLRPKRGGRSPYGDGRAGERIAAILASVQIGTELHRKRLSYAAR